MCIIKAQKPNDIIMFTGNCNIHCDVHYQGTVIFVMHIIKAQEPNDIIMLIGNCDIHCDVHH